MPKRTLQGVVVSDKQAKTVVVRVDRRFTHPIYKKTIRRSKNYHAHDEDNQFKPGDMRVGRGIGSGKGKTSGRGGKGQTARSGVRIKGFEGGQMPLHRRLPKRGFNNIFRLDFAEINLDRLQEAIDAKLVDAKETVTVESLVKAGVIRRAKDGLRLLGRGELKAKLAIEVHGASKSAVEAVEKAGGTVKILAPAKKEEGEAA